MKTTLVTILLSFSQLSFAAIANSDYEARHQKVMEKAIEEACGPMRNLEVVSSVKKTIKVDQGITDVEFVTLLTGKVRVDQNIFDAYKITVKSNYWDSYDHQDKEWGSYSVESVSCEFAE